MTTAPTLDTFIQRFLRQAIIDWPYLYVDYWSIIHFCSGLILGVIFASYFCKKFSWLIVLGFLILYEVFEIMLDGILFDPETLVDKFWDIVIGMIGFFITYFIFTKKNN